VKFFTTEKKGREGSGNNRIWGKGDKNFSPSIKVGDSEVSTWSWVLSETQQTNDATAIIFRVHGKNSPRRKLHCSGQNQRKTQTSIKVKVQQCIPRAEKREKKKEIIRRHNGGPMND